MIDYRQWQTFAAKILTISTVTEIEIRRSVSAIYYGLFHRLAAEGASVFQQGGHPLVSQAARAFSHSAMLDVCNAYSRLPKNPLLPSPLNRLASHPTDPRLVTVAQTFVVLQEARHAADYDLSGELLRSTGLDLLNQAEHAHWMLDQVQGLPETTIFLTALLLHDRWKRRG